MAGTFVRGRGWPPAVVATALIVALCAACGSSSKGTNSASGAASSTAVTQATGGVSGCASSVGVTPTQVKVGVLWDQTGANAAGGGAFGAGVHARFDAANQSGGVNGRKVVEADADTQSNPGSGLAAAEGLVQSNGVSSILIGSQIIPTVFPYMERIGVPLFDPLAGVPAFATSQNLISAAGAFDPATKGTLTTPIIVRYLQQSGVKTLALFSHNTPSGLANLGPIAADAKKVGISVVYENTAIPFSAFDATSIALRVKQLKPDAAYLGIALPPSISIVHSLQEQGYVPKVTLLATGYSSQTLSAGIAGASTTSQYVPFLGPISQLTKPAQDFRNAMATYEPTATLTTTAAFGWVTADLFLHAVELAGKCPTESTIVSKIRSEASYNPGGITADPIRFSPGLTPDGNPANCLYIVTINSGAFSAPKAPLCV